MVMHCGKLWDCLPAHCHLFFQKPFCYTHSSPLPRLFDPPRMNQLEVTELKSKPCKVKPRGNQKTKAEKAGLQKGEGCRFTKSPRENPEKQTQFRFSRTKETISFFSVTEKSHSLTYSQFLVPLSMGSDNFFPPQYFYIFTVSP